MKLLLNRLLQRGVWSYYSEADIDALVAAAYIPVATHAELNQVRTAAAATFGAGTKWVGTYTGGVDKKYIQVADIDLTAATRAGGVYDNGGEGWQGIGGVTAGTEFSGTYDGGGHVIEGMFINTTTQQGALFRRPTNATIKNLAVLNADVTSNQNFFSILSGNNVNAEYSNIVVTGSVTQSALYAGAIAGLITTGSTITNCFAIVSVSNTSNYTGGLIGGTQNSTLTNCYSAGLVTAGGTDVGGLVGRKLTGNTVTDCYYDTTTSGQVDNDGYGTPLTTAEMYALTAASTGWSVNDWIFGWGQRYPRLRAFKNTEI